MDKGLCSVDRVDDPAVVRGAFGGPVFFAHDLMIGISLCDAMPDQFLGLPVRDRHGGVVRFELGPRPVREKIFQSESPGLAGGQFGEGEKIG